ncbi:MAG TPA: nucleotidyl transferase AbiEii/AbiGii toxin family protein [Candidatus Paceibacterota bacterium]
MRSDKEKLDQIKRIAIISLFSDDELMDKFVLKGGNALSLIYKLIQRESIDIDVSIEEDFENVEKTINKIQKLLVQNFDENNYYAFDIKLSEKPRIQEEELKSFWGGYRLEFKVIEKEIFNKLNGDVEKIRKSALILGSGEKKNFKIDISKWEYCKGKEAKDLDDYTIYVYSPLMIVYEKLRAICQQNMKYKTIVSTMKRSPRPRDFYDIYYVLKNLPEIDITDVSNLEILKSIFEIKKVPLYFLEELENDFDYHNSEYENLQAIVEQDTKLEDFRFYFDFIKEKVNSIKFFWEEQMPAI